MRVQVDRERCTAAGMCALTAPEVFDQDDADGRVVLLDAHPGPAMQERAEEAVALCPSAALSIDHESSDRGA